MKTRPQRERAGETRRHRAGVAELTAETALGAAARIVVLAGSGRGPTAGGSLRPPRRAMWRRRRRRAGAVCRRAGGGAAGGGDDGRGSGESGTARRTGRRRLALAELEVSAEVFRFDGATSGRRSSPARPRLPRPHSERGSHPARSPPQVCAALSSQSAHDDPRWGDKNSFTWRRKSASAGFEIIRRRSSSCGRHFPRYRG